MKIIFPELSQNSIAAEAVKSFPDIEFFGANSLEEAVNLLMSGAADSMISGLDYSSRDVLIAYKNSIPLKSPFFSSCFICERTEPDGSITHFALADGGVNKLPDEAKLLTIVEDTATTYQTYYREQPRIAMLSYSTYGSGGKNPDLTKIHYVIDTIRATHPDWLIDGEMQLDAAISPDLNSGNILYKSCERFGGFTIAGPIIQGFTVPLADLSRGSTVADVILTIKVLQRSIK